MTEEPYRYYRALLRARSPETLPTASTKAKLARTAVAGALLVLPAACGTGDEAIFATATTQTNAPAAEADASTSTPTTGPSTTGPSTTGPSTIESSTSAAPTGEAAPVGGQFPAGSEMLVSFTYEPSTAGRAERPYIAVWVEDADGTLVETISLWFQQDRKGTKWLNDLTRWHRASGGDDTTMSGATKVAGEYTVAWDGTDSNGDLVPAGDYVINVESSREDGPTSYTSSSISIASNGFSINLDDDGELVGASAVHSI